MQVGAKQTLETEAPTGHESSRSAKKRAAILEAARQLFLENGFSETSMDAVTAQAGVSKSTVYSHFETKEDLFEAVVRARAEQVLAQLKAFGQPSGDPSKDLEAFGFIFQKVVLVPEARAWHRLVLAQAERHPELARSLFEAGPAQVLGLLESYLREQSKQGRLNIRKPGQAAEQFVGLIVGAELIRGLFGVQPRRTDRERRERAKRAVSVFMAACGTEQNARSLEAQQ